MLKRILVIDDEEPVRKSFVLALEDLGVEIDTASNGEEGLRKLKEKKTDLIFLDLKMPGMNGVEVLREIRKVDENVPVHIQTAFYKEFMDLLSAAVKEGIKFELLNKPVASEQIVAVTKGSLGEASEY